MGLLSWIKQIFVSEGVKGDISDPIDINKLVELIGSANISASGVSVTPEAAMRQATVYSCIRLLSETISQLPLHLYRRTESGRERAADHPYYSLLRIAPNGYMTASEFWQFKAAAVLLRGMACSYKNRIGNKVVELIPISPSSVDEVWTGGRRAFHVVFADGTAKILPPEDIFCIKGLSLNGREAISPIKYAANSVGLSISAQDYSAKFYKNGARPSGLLKTPGTLDETKVELMKAAWKSQYNGEKAGSVAVLSGGLDFQPISMSNEDAQLLEILGFNRTEICGIFGVPPHMIGAIEKTSSWGTGLAEQSLSFIKYTIAPWLNRIEQSIIRDILPLKDRQQYYPEFLTEQFLRGDTKNRYESYKLALGGTQNPGFMTPNETRRLENLPPIEGGDSLYRPVSKAGAEEGVIEHEKQAET